MFRPIWTLKGAASCATLQFLLECIGGKARNPEVVLGPGTAEPRPRALRCLGWTLSLTCRFGGSWYCWAHCLVAALGVCVASAVLR